jgi:exonuclease SbcC
LLASKKKDEEKVRLDLSFSESALEAARKSYAEKNYRQKLDDLVRIKSESDNVANSLRAEIAYREVQMKEIADAKKYLPEIQDEINSQNRKLEDVRELIIAYGDKGIKALLIDQMLPSIAKEANNVLSMLSEGRFTLDMTTLKETKKGDEVETLDILLYKDGIRDRYENLSGGEKFKVNFALRIGLSKYLSEAADTRLDTLVIDEGFGSQDYVGRLNALRAIQAVSDRFGLILVITHFNDIQRAFDYEVETSKDAEGFSHANVVYHPAA